MQRDRLVTGLAVGFAAMTGLLVLAGVALREPFVLFVALPLAAATYLFWYQASGRLRERASRRVRRGRDRSAGGFGAGPRGERAPPGGRRDGADGSARRRNERRRGTSGRRRAARRSHESSLEREEAYRRLGLDTDASEAAVKRAYRERVKEVHPDRGGDEEAFRELTEAYERLRN